MKYVEITAVPLKHEESILHTPIEQIVSRLLCVDDVLELRIQSNNGSIKCYIGTNNIFVLDIIKNTLSFSGYLFDTKTNPEQVYTNTIFKRNVRKKNLRNNSLVLSGVLLSEIELISTNISSMYKLLCSISFDAGYSMFFRRSSGLNSTSESKINLFQLDQSSFMYKMANSMDLYEVACCSFLGIHQNIINSEIQSLFSFVSQSIDTIPIDERIFDCYKYLEKNNPVFQLNYTYTLSEINNITNISESCGEFGLPINKDTLFGGIFPFNENYKEKLHLGKTSNEEQVNIDLNSLRQHMFIGGAPGAGKGNLLFSIALQLHKKKIPLLMIESAKQEQHHLTTVMEQLRVWRPVDGGYIFNPFELPPDVTLGEYRASLIQMLKIAFQLEGPLEELFTEALNRCFSNNGFYDDSTINSEYVTPFGLNEFIKEYNTLLEEQEYGNEVKSNIKTAGLVRLNNLFNQNQAVFDTVRSIPINELAKGENLLQLNSLTSMESKQLFATMLLVSLGSWLKLRGTHSPQKLRLVIILDESHNLLRGIEKTNGDKYSFADDFSNLLLEMRSLGVGFIIADQSSENLPPIIPSVCATKIFLGPSRFSGVTENREFLNADDIGLDHMYLLKPGEGVFSTYGLPFARYFYTENIIDTFNIQDDIRVNNSFLESHNDFTLKTFNECCFCPTKDRCTLKDKSVGRKISSQIYAKYSSAHFYTIKRYQSSQNDDEKNKYINNLCNILSDVIHCITKQTESESARVCSYIQYIRILIRSKNIKFDIKKEINTFHKNLKKME